MKNASSLLVLLFLSCSLVAQTTMAEAASQTTLTDEERSMVVGELEKSRDLLSESVAGLTEAQLNYKNSEDAWSIAECVEHLAISEKAFGEMLKGALEKEADASRRMEVKMTDGDLLNIIRDRSNKVKTSEPFEPSGKFGSHEETLGAMVGMRNAHIAYMQETQDDLRNRYGELPFGTIDGVQMILFMSGHTERHTAQIMEIKESNGFPSE